MLRVLKYSSLCILLLLMFIFFSGEKPTFEKANPVIHPIEIALDSLDFFIQRKESQILDLKPGNQARIVWADSLNKVKTEFSVVYLHGFSASQEEGDPIHEAFARRYGCNLFLSRLEDHGRLDSNSLKYLTPANFLESAKEAIAIGQILGDKVIVMSCSTGGTLSAYLAAYNPSIYAQIMYSPNIDLYDISSEFVTMSWGKKLTRIVMGSDYKYLSYAEEPAKFWNTSYHTNGIIALKYMLENWMVKETFIKINQPTLVACYYKDRKHQDKVVSVKKMRKFYNLISTPAFQKVYSEMKNTKTHAICSKYFSKDVETVKNQTFEFAEKILGLQALYEQFDSIEFRN